MKTPKVIFYLKADKANTATGEQPIYCRITVDGKRSNISINRWVQPHRWKATNKLQNARKNEDKELNFYMESIRTKIKEIERELIDSKTPVTSENIKNSYFGKTAQSKSLIEVFEWHNNNFQEMVDNEDRSEGTLDRYKCVLKHLVEFLKIKYNKSDIALVDLTFPFISDFEHYLRSTRIGEKGRTNKCKNNSAVKYIRNFRRVIRRAIVKGWLKYDVFTAYEGKIHVENPTYLTPAEIQKIEEKLISNPRLNTIRDIFLFSVYTGYSYIDVKHLTYAKLQRHIDGELWIFTKRIKNKVDENVMALHPALKIVDKYRDHPTCKQKGVLIPVISNQRLNTYLKELADICGIEKNLTFHVARHTFATSIMLANGASLETTMSAIGHKYIKQTQHYARVLNSKVSADMKKLNDIFRSKQSETLLES